MPALPAIELLDLLLPAYSPCAGFRTKCADVTKWAPESGHVPRGYLGATARLDDVDLILLVARTGRPPRRAAVRPRVEEEESRCRNRCRHLPLLSGRDRPVSSQRATNPRPGLSRHAVRHPVEQDLDHQHVPLLCAKRGGPRSGRRGEILRRDVPPKRADSASRTSDHRLGREGKAAGAPPRAVNPRSGGACSDRIRGSAPGRQSSARPSVLARRCRNGQSVDGRASRRGSDRRSLNTANPRRVSGSG